MPHDSIQSGFGAKQKFEPSFTLARIRMQIAASLPSVAIPLLRAAYDESRPELQQIWAKLIAAAIDPNRSGQFRLSFIATLKQFDPLDAQVLKARQPGTLSPN